MQVMLIFLLTYLMSKGLGNPSVNSLSPEMKMHILLPVFHTFLMELVRRICLNIETSYPW